MALRWGAVSRGEEMVAMGIRIQLTAVHVIEGDLIIKSLHLRLVLKLYW